MSEIDIFWTSTGLTCVMWADTSTDHVIPFIQDNIIHRQSHPKRLVSDQGLAFSSKEFDARMTEWRIDHIPATPEHPQTNGLVERLNRTATLAIAAYLNTSHTDWDVKLQGAALAVNTARQSTTEITPFEMVYGRRPVTRKHQCTRKQVSMATRTSGTVCSICATSG